jgi:two-component system cell cycle response regulator
MNRALVVTGAGIAVLASYLVVILGIAPDTSVGPLAFASIAVPGIVTGLVMAAYVMWETRNALEARQHSNELSAQLMRREIEIGRLSTVDEQTGLYTRREFDQLLRLEIERFRRHRHTAAVLLLQIDDVTRQGASVGHLSKGLLLAELSDILKRVLRSIDLGCRYSHDAVGLLLPETDVDQALVVAGKVQAAVSEHGFLGQAGDSQTRLHLTVSQGIAVVGPWATSESDVLHAAEQALMDARTAGTDQVNVVEARAA